MHANFSKYTPQRKNHRKHIQRWRNICNCFPDFQLIHLTIYHQRSCYCYGIHDYQQLYNYSSVISIQSLPADPCIFYVFSFLSSLNCPQEEQTSSFSSSAPHFTQYIFFFSLIDSSCYLTYPASAAVASSALPAASIPASAAVPDLPHLMTWYRRFIIFLHIHTILQFCSARRTLPLIHKNTCTANQGTAINTHVNHLLLTVDLSSGLTIISAPHFQQYLSPFQL